MNRYLITVKLPREHMYFFPVAALDDDHANHVAFRIGEMIELIASDTRCMPYHATITLEATQEPASRIVSTTILDEQLPF